MTVQVAENEDSLVSTLSALIAKTAGEAIEEKGAYYIGVSGGSVVKFLLAGLPTINTDYSKWRIFFCDERVVPENDPESTFGTYKTNLIGKTALTEENFVKIKQGVSAQDAATDYISKIKKFFPNDNLPRFDLLLLGMGPDGHTCSLFPGHPLLSETSVWVAPITDSPKPPPERVTLTFPVVNNAKNCVFVISGEGKAEMIKRVLGDKEDLPVNRVSPKSGSLYWLLDKAAAKLLET